MILALQQRPVQWLQLILRNITVNMSCVLLILVLLLSTTVNAAAITSPATTTTDTTTTVMIAADSSINFSITTTNPGSVTNAINAPGTTNTITITCIICNIRVNIRDLLCFTVFVSTAAADSADSAEPSEGDLFVSAPESNLTFASCFFDSWL